MTNNYCKEQLNSKRKSWFYWNKLQPQNSSYSHLHIEQVQFLRNQWGDGVPHSETVILQRGCEATQTLGKSNIGISHEMASNKFLYNTRLEVWTSFITWFLCQIWLIAKQHSKLAKQHWKPKTQMIQWNSESHTKQQQHNNNTQHIQWPQHKKDQSLKCPHKILGIVCCKSIKLP